MQWFTVMVSIILFSCSGPKNVIQSAEAFIVTPQQGTVKVDEKGNEVDPIPSPVIVVFVHCTSNKVNWDSAWLGNSQYPVLQQPVTQPLEMGTDATTGNKIMIRPQEGSYLFQLQVNPRPLKGEEWAGSIRVRASYRNKTILKEVAPIRTITTPDAQ